MSPILKVISGLALSIFSSEALIASSITFNGSQFIPIEISPASSTGINSIYVLYDINNVSVTYTADSDGSVVWSRYSNLGGGYAEEITNGITFNGRSSTLNSPEGNLGYIIRENDRNYIFWLVDYNSFPISFQSISESEESGCDMTVLKFEGSATPIHFYDINGRQETLSREIKLSYKNLEWDEDNSNYIETPESVSLSSVNQEITVIPPIYCSTIFELSGDRFLEEWGMPLSIQSSTVYPSAVDVHTIVETENNKDEDYADNQITTDSEGLGGSAPFTATFYSYSTDAVIHNEWQMASDSDFENITYRINEADLNYTFTEQGTTYLRFIGSNSDGSCESISDTYTVNIGDSRLLIPNIFSPDGDGINDIWKVSYRSLIEFRCWIFDRHGHELYYFDDPAGGWDGKNGSKFVKPGVYYYVIEALGADGKKYKKGGDINILRSYGGSGVSSVE